MARLLLVGGHETTANMIALGALTLLRHPTELARLRADPSLIPSAVEELLRFLTVIDTALSRVATADAEVGGVRVAAGQGVLLGLAAANRDPRVFDDPDRLHLDRDNSRHVSFGYGVHQCLGQALARVELQVALDALFHRLPALHLDTTPDAIPYRMDTAVSGLHALPVRW